MKSKNSRLLIGVAVIVAAIAFLMVTAFSGNTMYYYKVDEVLAKQSQLQGKALRVQGAVVPGSVHLDITVPLLTFKLKGDQGGTIAVQYHGVKPDNMDQATAVIAEGRLSSTGVLDASKLLLQCPSKYESDKKGS
ncbi:MAG: cytochrome c maturation protein CcmE [Firmicutes bacterium]|nr:cytochrome c maturation protein CcmE [Bacillota bacterium]